MNSKGRQKKKGKNNYFFKKQMLFLDLLIKRLMTQNTKFFLIFEQKNQIFGNQIIFYV